MRAFPTLALCAALLSGQQPAPRDQTGRPQRRVGTGVIRGRVVAGDSGAPIRRAIVSIYGEGRPPVAGTTITDVAGGFIFNNLPPDTYHLSVRPSRFHTRYLARPLGGVAAAGNPVTVALADGQIVDSMQIALARAGAIVGHVLDANGDPLTGIGLQAERAPGTPDTGSWHSATSDDLGRFRLFNLAPGEYYVLARGGDLEDKQAGERPATFLPTYAPGTASRAEATKVRVEAGREVAIDLQMLTGRTYTISGMVLDSQGRPATRGEVMISRFDRFGGGSTGIQLDGTSRFRTPEQPPGEYRLSAKILDDAGALLEYTKVPVTIADADITDVVLTTKPAVKLTGRVVFLEGAPQPPPAFDIVATAFERRDAPESFLHARVRPDLTFSFPRIFGDVLLRIPGLVATWRLKAVLRGDEDITDKPVAFTDKDAGRVQIVVSSRMSTIDGHVVDDMFKPAAGSIVLLLPEQVDLRRAQSSRFGYAFTDRTGAFKIGGVHAGRYFIVAVSRGEADGYQEAGPEFFERLLPSATSVLIGDDEVRTIDLKLSTGG